MSYRAEAIPYLGTVKGFQETITGVNYITGEQLSVGDRIANGVGTLTSLIPIPGAKYVGKYGTEGVIDAGGWVVKQFGKDTGTLGISKITTSSPGQVIFGELDHLDRPTGITATITKNMIGTGSKASQSIKPPGFMGGGPGSAGHARGHLLGNQLGGSGKDDRNLVTLYQNPINSPLMRDFETSVRVAVEKGEVVRYQVIPIYKGNKLMPEGVTLRGRGTEGFSLDVTIINRK